MNRVTKNYSDPKHTIWGVEPRAGWPKHRVLERFETAGEEAARKLARRLGVSANRTERWLTT